MDTTPIFRDQVDDLNAAIGLAFDLAGYKLAYAQKVDGRQVIVFKVLDEATNVFDYFAGCLICDAVSVRMPERSFAEHWFCEACEVREVGKIRLLRLTMLLRALHSKKSDLNATRTAMPKNGTSRE